MNACLGELPTAGDDDPKKAAEDGSITREAVLRLLGAHQEDVEALQAEVARLAAREPGGGDDGRPDAECLEEMLDAEGEGFTGLPVDRLYEKADESYFFRVQCKAVRAAPKRLLDAYHGVGWLSPVCICLALFHMSARFQRHTQRGRLVSADDDSWRGATHASLTASYNYTMYAVLIVLLVDAQLAAYVSLADEARGSWRPLAEATAWFLVDGLVLALIRQIALRYAVHCLLPYTMSEETWPMHFWKRLDPTPNRPNEQSYYAYDYYGATDDAYS